MVPITDPQADARGTAHQRTAIEGPPEDASNPGPPLAQRLVWFVVLWVGGLAVTAGLAYVLRTLLFL